MHSICIDTSLSSGDSIMFCVAVCGSHVQLLKIYRTEWLADSRRCVGNNVATHYYTELWGQALVVANTFLHYPASANGIPYKQTAYQADLTECLPASTFVIFPKRTDSQNLFNSFSKANVVTHVVHWSLHWLKNIWSHNFFCGSRL